MSKSNTVDVLVKLPYGILIGEESYGIGTGPAAMAMDSARIHLPHGLTENVPRARIERWLKINAQLTCVRNGSVRILDTDRLAVDSGSSTNRKK